MWFDTVEQEGNNVNLISRRKTAPDDLSPAAAVLVTWPLALSSILHQGVTSLL